MTLLTTTRSDNTRLFRRRLSIFLGRLGRLLDDWVAFIIADFERRAEIAALQHLSDQQLKDIGLYRGQIEGAVDEAARDRLRQQNAIGS
jgi:uncharacterized protein YjiS (DUF1127 family)